MPARRSTRSPHVAREGYLSLEEARKTGKLVQRLLPKAQQLASTGNFAATWDTLDIVGVCVNRIGTGYSTPIYRLKKKLVEAFYGIKITEWRT